jgi:dethiobiotin synthetase
MTKGYFVTGTDTGVGKTVVSCALLYAFAARGLRAAGMKPVAAGAEWRDGVLTNDDVEQLLAAGNVAAPRALVNPYCFAPPIAPHIAAARAGARVALDRIVSCYGGLAALADVVVVEGAGGFRVPLAPGVDVAELAGRLGLPVVLVVGMRLGCINHALLTAEAVAAHGLTLAGWVPNHLDPHMEAADENVRALEERLTAPLLTRIAYTAHIEPRAVASQLNLLRLH